MKPIVLLITTVAFVACSKENAQPRDTIKITMTPVASDSSAGPVTAGSPGCEHTGQWAECSLERRLKQSGFVVKRLDERVDRKGFSIKPVVYALGSSRLEAFFYRSEGALVKDWKSLDTLTASPAGAPSQWPESPTVVRSANLAVVFIGRSPRQSERLALAITAGPPQPGSPR